MRGLAGFLLCLALLLSGCPRAALLENTLESDEALARAVLDAIARSDQESLLRLAVTKDEFEDLVWPTLPVSRPAVGMPIDYVWHDTLTKSRAYLTQTLAEFGGTWYGLVRVQFRGETTDHGTYVISRKTQLVVRDGQGREQTVRFFGSIIRQRGRCKVFSYIID